MSGKVLHQLTSVRVSNLPCTMAPIGKEKGIIIIINQSTKTGVKDCYQVINMLASFSETLIAWRPEDLCYINSKYYQRVEEG